MLLAPSDRDRSPELSAERIELSPMSLHRLGKRRIMLGGQSVQDIDIMPAGWQEDLIDTPLSQAVETGSISKTATRHRKLFNEDSMFVEGTPKLQNRRDDSTKSR